MNRKELNAKYYHGIIHTLQIYILSTVLCILFERFYLKENISIKYAIFSILDGDIGYSWYVEMYIGLFLLIPFLNIDAVCVPHTSIILSSLPSYDFR